MVTRGVVLVVDDDDDLRATFGDELADRGYEVVEARNGREALDYLETHPPPQLIFLDLTMPIMDGMAFLEARRSDARTAAIPVIVISAREPMPWNLDVARIFRKPLDMRAVERALADVVR
jgi:CheY-like chemotaxis protein